MGHSRTTPAKGNDSAAAAPLGRAQPYGDLTALNRDGLILTSVGREMLDEVASSYLDVLETSSAVYELNGDYAMGIFSSGWCRKMDSASRALCGSADNREALACGKWRCHESCWKDASLPAIQRGETVDVECAGGIRLFAAPIRVGDQVVGALNFGYGPPPRDPDKLRQLAQEYAVPVEELQREAEASTIQPPVVVDAAKRQLRTAAKLIGEMVARKGAERAAVQAEQRLRFHTDNSSLGLVEWDADHRILRWSSGAERIFGWTAAEATGKRLEDLPFIAEQDALAVEAVTASLVSGATPRSTLRNRNRRKDGTLIECEWFNSGEYDASGRLVSVLSQVDDVTQRVTAERAMQESERRFRGAVENYPYPFLIVGCDRRIRYVNAPTLAWAGYTQPQMLGRRLGELFPRARVREVEDTLERAFATRRPQRVEHLSGTARVLLIECIPLLDASGAVCEVEIVTYEITELRRAQHALEEADRRKDEFLAALGHELRNPLAPISNSLHILRRSAQPAQRDRAMTVMARQLEHMTRLIDDLLDVSRITRGTIQLRRERMDIVAAVGATLDDHRETLEKAGLAVETKLPEGPLFVFGDPTRVAQVLCNLLQNAAKFTDAGGRISVEVEGTDGRARVRVRDTGAGIDAATLAKLFQPFAQADMGLARTKGGLGLGLALVKGLTELHEGNVHAHSSGPGQGSEFQVEIPLMLDDVTTKANGSDVSAAARRVLVIEDNLDAADSLKEVLEMDGHVVAVAYDGKAGLTAAPGFAPDVVLCDIGLPGDLDGYAVARALRSEEQFRSVHLVALTGYAGPEDQRLAHDAGFDAHLAKPPDIDTLSRIVSGAPSRAPAAAAESAG